MIIDLKPLDMVVLKTMAGAGPVMYIERAFNPNYDGADSDRGDGHYFCRWIDNNGRPQEAWWPGKMLQVMVF